MATKLLNRDNLLDNVRQFRVFDDFIEFVDGTVWDVTKDTTATVAVDADGVGGLLLMTTHAADNDEAYIDSLEIFKVATDKPMLAVMRASVDGATTANQQDFIFGLMDGVGANAITDAGAPAASKHMAVFFKPSGQAVLEVQSTSSAAGTYETTTTEVSVTEGSYHTYAILVEPLSSTDKRVTFYVDTAGGQDWSQCRDNTTRRNVIRHSWSLADTAAATGELSLMCGLKASSAEAQVLTVDYLGCWQLR